MGQQGINNIFIPQVTKRPGEKQVDLSNKLSSSGETSDFRTLLDHQLTGLAESHGLKISHHAAKRLKEREIHVDSDEWMRIKEGVDKLKAKGGQDSLVITDYGVYIVDVKNGTIVTAIDKQDMAKNVFTKIDSTVFID